MENELWNRNCRLGGKSVEGGKVTGADKEEVLEGFIRIRWYGTKFGVILGCLGAARTVGPKWLEKVLEAFF